MSREVFEVAINAYITFRGEAESEEDFVDQVFDEFWEWLKANPKPPIGRLSKTTRAEWVNLDSFNLVIIQD